MIKRTGVALSAAIVVVAIVLTAAYVANGGTEVGLFGGQMVFFAVLALGVVWFGAFIAAVLRMAVRVLRDS